MSYRSESDFFTTQDNRTIYSLRQSGWNKGKPIMVNDIAISIEARHLPEETQLEIAEYIRAKLSEKFGTYPSMK